MSNSYRIRTKPGVDSSIRVLVDQEFEYLEILSLKILQDQIYNRQCSDYGVVVGRVSVNNGFGIPNAKVSIFIPLDSVDENDPVISDLYPYKTLTDLNDEGYRYNLLPYKQQHGGHTPTGTFFTREDVLTNPTLIEVYDKYYKYNTVTNESGDYMIFGVPVGSQTIVVDIDLSDIGEFSLSPQDLIRMGVATENQVSGIKFKSSTNLRELPQIITFNRTLEVEPLWGQPDICNLGITRTDFDVTSEANINITPTAVFMGSLVSSNDDTYLKRNCKSKPTAGDLCKLTAGPGEILAIRQTIQQDIDGRPILEAFDLEQGGQVIDDNGTWMIDVPMNLDYVTTNEFGDRVLSSDPKVGIPTKSKYRFKVKWNQSPSISADPIKRGYYLVPNIKEYGWQVDVDPLTNTGATTQNIEAFTKSYAFSLDWNDYGNTGTTMGQQMIQEAIDCGDRFYEMSYNKVYTISQLISQYRNAYGNSKIISIKDILDSECTSDNNRFPTNDAVYKFDIIYLLFQLLMYLMRPTIYSLLIISHVLAFLLLILGPVLALVAVVVMFVVTIICHFINLIISAINLIPGININKLNCPDIADIMNIGEKMLELYKLFTTIQLPNLSYPDCEFCSCSEGVPTAPPDEAIQDTGLSNLYQSAEENGANAILSTTELFSSYDEQGVYYTTNSSYENLYGGEQMGVSGSTQNPLTPETRAPQIQYISDDPTTAIFTTSLPIYERLNLFNNKSKYFNNSTNNPGGGVNRIKVSFNTGDTFNYHYDNVITILANPNNISAFQAGNIISFQAPILSNDINITGVTSLNQYGTNSIIGSTINNSGGVINVNYADFNNPNNLLSTTYTSQQDPNDATYARFPMDIEYFQVITASTYSNFNSLCGTSLPNSLNERFLKNTMSVYRFERTSAPNYSYFINYQFPTPINSFTNGNDQILVFLVRGVDPNTTRQDCSYDLSLLYGYNSFGQPGLTVNGKYKLNIPVQPGFKNTQHNLINNTDTDLYSGNKLYYDSYHFQPDLTQFSSFTSNLVSYYSKLDGNNMSFNPNPYPPTSAPIMSNAGFTNGSNGVKVNSSNKFTLEYNDIENDTYNVNSPSTVYNRGYFVNEIIEGGSGLSLKIGQLPTSGTNDDPLYPSGDYLSIYYAPSYSDGVSSVTMNYLLSGGNPIVMRSDRLPTSTTEQINIKNSFPLHSNLSFSLFQINEDGTSVAYTGTTVSGISTGANQDALDNSDQPSIIQEVFNSFNCGEMVPLSCYKTDGSSLFVASDGDDCYKNPFGGKPKMINGCYSFVSIPLISLPGDLLLLTEWSSRLSIMFGTCRNVFGHMFTNNWINGTLYAFGFRADAVYTSVSDPNPNQLISGATQYCKDVVVLHPTVNFYYRSSPYYFSNNQFIGKKLPTGFFGSYKGNEYSLQYPTTMMDLGPRTDYIQQIVMSDDYDGYVSNKLNSTTFSDVSEILNLFIVSRLANTNFLTQLIGGANMLTFFSRDNNMVDADYAQAISVNSEVGVAPFESANYSQPDQIYVSLDNGKEPIFGIFFTSDTQVRDYITPKRTILNPNTNQNNPCAFNYFNVFTQEVPMYQWDNSVGNPSKYSQSIFGKQTNDWYTSPLTGNKFMSEKYQSMDRLLASSRYFRTNNNSQTDFFKGYIYSVDGSGNLEWNISSKSPNTTPSDVITVGTPFHFYFGLKKGKTAYDRFLTKWVDTNNLI